MIAHACTPKSASSYNNSTSQTMWPRGSSKWSNHRHHAATTRKGKSRCVEYMIVWRRYGIGSEIRNTTEQAMMENNGTANIFQLTPLVSTGRARARCLPFMDHLLQEMNTRMLVAQVRSVHHIETTGASDRKNSPAAWSVVWGSASTIKQSCSLEGMMGYDECLWETRQRD